jgi:Flp pilus assembly protein TadD
MKNLITLLFMFASLSLGAAENSKDDWQTALDFSEKAENEVRNDNNPEAVVLLNSCVKKLKAMQYKYPSWNSSVVKNRLRITLARIDEVEGLIRTKINTLSKTELVKNLQEALVAKTKFSKAMMIIYEQHKQTKSLLKLKQRDLDNARQAAGGKLVNQDQLDKFSFENLKLRKTLQELEAKIENLKKNLKSKNHDNGIAELKKSLENQILLTKIQEKKFLRERLKDKNANEDLSNKLKLISEKYRTNLNGEKKKNEALNERIAVIEMQELEALREKEKLKQQKLTNQIIQEKLTLSEKRIQAYQTAEKNYLKKLENVKSNHVDPKTFVKMTKENLKLLTENNRLRKIEVDLNAKVEKKEQMLNKSINSATKSNLTLQTQVKDLREKVDALNKKNLLASSNIIRLNSDLSSGKDKMKAQKALVDDLKGQIIKHKANAPVANNELTQAYAKNEKQLIAKLKFANEKAIRLERQNKTLKDENIVGDEEMIRKYIKVRNELKKYKETFNELSGADDQGKQQILETVISDEDKKVKEQRRQINNFLFKAQQATKDQKIQAAIGLYSQVLKIDRKNFDALVRLGLLHYQRRHFHDAKVHLNKAFYLNPDSPQVLLALGISELELSHLELAVSFLGRLVGINPKDATARLQLGISLQGLGWNKAAIVQLQKACELDPSSSDAAFNLAMVYLSLPEPKIKEAQENYKRAVKLGVVRDTQLEKFFKQQQE